MTVSLSDLNVGDLLRVTDTHGNCFSVGDIVKVSALDASDIYAVRETDGVGQYLYVSQVEAVTGPEADLAAFRRQVVDKALAAAKEHGWCTEVQRVLVEELGLGDLVPTEETVEVSFHVVVTRQPGESNSTVQRRAREQARIVDDAERVYYNDSRIIE